MPGTGLQQAVGQVLQGRIVANQGQLVFVAIVHPRQQVSMIKSVQRLLEGDASRAGSAQQAFQGQSSPIGRAAENRPIECTGGVNFIAHQIKLPCAPGIQGPVMVAQTRVDPAGLGVANQK